MQEVKTQRTPKATGAEHERNSHEKAQKIPVVDAARHYGTGARKGKNHESHGSIRMRNNEQKEAKETKIEKKSIEDRTAAARKSTAKYAKYAKGKRG